MDVTSLMRQAAQHNAGFTAIITQDRSLTFSEAWSRGVRLANALIALGVRPGDRVAGLQDNNLGCVDLYLATAIAGAVRVPLYPRNSRQAHHDMLTGTNDQGTLALPVAVAPPPGSPPGTPDLPAPDNMTCNNWTSSGPNRAMTGHLDRKGAGASGPSWVAAHASRGCSQPELVVSGGAGLYYCFAAN